jgi:DNA-binding FadR family transcriptional regulator
VDRPAQVAFHGLIAQASHNRLLAASVTAAINISREFTSKLDFSHQDGRLDFSYNQRLYDCVAANDPDRARRIMSEHFEQSKTLVSRYREQVESGDDSEAGRFL